MPVYDYKCNNCGYKFEVYRSVNETDTPECPNCHSKDTVKVFTASVYFKFVGSGFYENDYKNKK